MAVREEQPGGYIREIKGIRIADQPENLFQVPDGYQLIDNNKQK
jgi:hypothetical protein